MERDREQDRRDAERLRGARVLRLVRASAVGVLPVLAFANAFSWPEHRWFGLAMLAALVAGLGVCWPDRTFWRCRLAVAWSTVLLGGHAAAMWIGVMTMRSEDWILGHHTAGVFESEIGWPCWFAHVHRVFPNMVPPRRWVPPSDVVLAPGGYALDVVLCILALVMVWCGLRRFLDRDRLFAVHLITLFCFVGGAYQIWERLRA